VRRMPGATSHPVRHSSCGGAGWPISRFSASIDRSSKCVYSDDQVEAARTFILQNWKCRPFQDLLKVDYEYMLTKPLGAGGKKGLACAICVACDSSSKCTSMLQKQDGAMQIRGPGWFTRTQKRTPDKCGKSESFFEDRVRGAGGGRNWKTKEAEYTGPDGRSG
jgi:hypothetical protein